MSSMSFFAVQICNVSLYSIVFFILYWSITSLHTEQLPDGLIAQLVEHYAKIGEVIGPNPVQA